MSQMWPNEDDLALFWLRNGEPLSADNVMRASKEIYQRLIKQSEAGLLSSCLIPVTLGDRSLLEPRIVLPSSGTIDKLQTGTPFELGIAVGGTSVTIVLPSGASSVNNYYNGYKIRITDGTGQGQERTIVSYVGSTRTATVAAWVTTPDTTSQYELSYRRLADDDIIVIGNLIFKGSEISSYEIVWGTAPASNTDYLIYYGQDKILAAREYISDPAMSDPNKLYIARITRQAISGAITYMEDLRGFTFGAQNSQTVRYTPGSVRIYGTVAGTEISGANYWIIGNDVRWNDNEWNGKVICFSDNPNVFYPIIDTRAYTSPSSKSAVLVADINPPAGTKFVIIDTRISGDSVYEGLLHHGHQGGNDGEQITTPGIADVAITTPKIPNAAITVPKLDNFTGNVAENKIFASQTFEENHKIAAEPITEFPYGHSRFLTTNMVIHGFPAAWGIVETVRMGTGVASSARGDHQIFWPWTSDPVASGTVPLIRYWQNFNDGAPVNWTSWTEFHEGVGTIDVEKFSADTIALIKDKPFLLVAAANAPDYVKAIADYQCVGTLINAVDHLKINDALSGINGAGAYRNVVLSAGNFYIGGNINMLEGQTLEGMGKEITSVRAITPGAFSIFMGIKCTVKNLQTTKMWVKSYCEIINCDFGNKNTVTAYDAGSHGITTYDTVGVDHVKIHGCGFDNLLIGVALYYAASNMIQDNSFRECQIGIYVSAHVGPPAVGTGDNLISGNNITHHRTPLSTQSGIGLGGQIYRTLVSENIIYGYAYGIYLPDSPGSGHTIMGNTMLNCSTPIRDGAYNSLNYLIGNTPRSNLVTPKDFLWTTLFESFDGISQLRVGDISGNRVAYGSDATVDQLATYISGTQGGLHVYKSLQGSFSNLGVFGDYELDWEMDVVAARVTQGFAFLGLTPVGVNAPSMPTICFHFRANGAFEYEVRNGSGAAIGPFDAPFATWAANRLYKLRINWIPSTRGAPRIDFYIDNTLAKSVTAAMFPWYFSLETLKIMNLFSSGVDSGYGAGQWFRFYYHYVKVSLKARW